MGEVSTPLMATENINFGPNSLFRDVEEFIKERTTAHLEKAMPPAEFARQVVHTVIDGKASFIWKGSNAFVVWLLDKVGPRTVFDSAMAKMAGLHTVEAKSRIFKLGQDRAKKSTWLATILEQRIYEYGLGAYCNLEISGLRLPWQRFNYNI